MVRLGERVGGGGWMVREGVDDEGIRVTVNGERGWV